MPEKAQVSSLSLVYPALSNQEAYWLRNDLGVVETLRMSDFYMVVGRAEAKFQVVEVDQASGEASLRLTVLGGPEARGVLRVGQVPRAAKAPNLVLEGGDKILRVWDRPKEEPGVELLDWFTTEKLLYDRSHGHAALRGFDNHRELATYELFYIGIAKKGDSFERLVANGHQKRMEILANEPQRHPNSRVSDETYLLFFTVQTLGVQSFGPGDDMSEVGVDFTRDRKRIVADAEKAFVKLLDPRYNDQKYTAYPRSVDGLYDSGLRGYAYVIDEDIVLNTGTATIKGAHDPLCGISNNADGICIQGEDVRLFVAGRDY
jgi:hypothetical protein